MDMNQIFIIVSNADPRVLTDVAFTYAQNAPKKGWMDLVRVILWGPAEKTVVSALELKSYVMDLVKQENVEVWACKQCSDDYEITEKLEQLGVVVKHVGADISQMLKDGWFQLTF